MSHAKIAFIPVLLTLAILLAGCGSSGHDLFVNSPLRITTQHALPAGRTNTAYNVVFSAAGGAPPYSWSASNLPPGMAMSTTGTLFGTPTQSGTFTLTAAASDLARATANGDFSLTIAAPLQIPSNTLNGGATGVSYFSSSNTVATPLADCRISGNVTPLNTIAQEPFAPAGSPQFSLAYSALACL